MSSWFRLHTLVLRKRHIGFGFVLTNALTANLVEVTGVRERELTTDMSAGRGDGSQRVNKTTNGLLLYYSQYSFYSQKVISFPYAIYEFLAIYQIMRVFWLSVFTYLASVFFSSTFFPFSYLLCNLTSTRHFSKIL